MGASRRRYSRPRARPDWPRSPSSGRRTATRLGLIYRGDLWIVDAPTGVGPATDGRRADAWPSTGRGNPEACTVLSDRSPPHRRGMDGGGQVRVLVTGGAGFIGSHVSDRLLEGRPPGRRGGQPGHRQPGEHRPPGRARATSASSSTTSRTSSSSPAGSMPCCISPRPPARIRPPPTATLSFRSRPSRSGRWARTMRWAWPASTRRASCWPRLPRSTAIPQEHPQRETYFGHVDPVGPALRI